MTSLGTEIALSLKRCFALLEDLQTLAPKEYAAIMKMLCDQLGELTRREAAKRLKSAGQR